MTDIREVLRRVVDITGSGLLLILTLPMFLAIALVAAWTYRAWPIFGHERVGLHGRPFRMIKVRTLPPTTGSYVDKYELNEAEIPRIMTVIRRTHLDELPQLWLVFIGKMSLVGPRPEMAHLHASLPVEMALERTSTRPGITGLWQISSHCDRLIGQNPEYDRLYVRFRNPALDAWILMRTVVKIVRGSTVQLYEVPTWTLRWSVPSTSRPTASGEEARRAESVGETTHAAVSSPS